MPVDTKCQAHQSMAPKWELTDALKSTEAMREKAETFLPREPKEKIEGYRVRLSRSFLRPAYWGAIRRLVSKAFRKPVTLQNEDRLSEAMQAISDDVDGAGTSITEFSRDAFEVGMNRGVTHALIDYPYFGTAGAGSSARFDRGARAYVVHVPPESLIGWDFTSMADGREVLTHIRYSYEMAEEDPSDSYQAQVVEFIREINIDPDTGEGEWIIWRKAQDDESFAMIESGTFRYSGKRIPLVSLYFRKTGKLSGSPPLWQLAEMNLQDWQVGSDESNNLRFMGFPRQFAAGFTDEDRNTMDTIGPAWTIFARDPSARFELVEHTGQSAAVQREYRERLRAEMEAEGMTPLTQRSGDITATGQVLDESSKLSDLERWIIATQIWLRDIYQVAASWRGEELPEDFTIDVAQDMGLTLDGLTPAEIRAMWRDGMISHDRALEEIKRRGHFAETFDVEAEVEAAREEMPAAGPGPVFVDGEEDVEAEANA